MPSNTSASQEFVPFKEVRDGILIMPSGEIKAVLMASSINMALKSQEEQEAVLMQFQSFLNSLDFSTQIVIQSRKFDIRPYVTSLEKRLEEETNDLLRTQIKEYIEFVKSFTDSANIMRKNFFIVVPYKPAGTASSSSGVFGSFFGSSNKNKKDENKEMYSFNEKRTQLEQRVSVISSGLARVGVKTARLGSEEVLELFYHTFNPGELGSIHK